MNPNGTNASRAFAKHSVINILRWLIALPLSIIGGAIVYWAYILFNSMLALIPLPGSLDLDSLYVRLFIVGLSHWLAGITYITIGFKVVPSHKKQAVVVMAGILLVVGGATLLTGVIMRDHWSMFSTVCLNVGSISGVLNILRLESQNLDCI